MLTKFVLIVSAFVMLAIISAAAIQPAAAAEENIPGGIFITGHDPDYHAAVGHNEGAQRIIQTAINYVTFDNPEPRILLVTSLDNPGPRYSDPRIGMIATNFTEFDVADYGSGEEGVFDINTIDLNDYDVIVVASDYGGWLTQKELDGLNNRATEIVEFVNNGGGIVAFSESGLVPPNEPDSSPTTVEDRYGFIPFDIGQESLTQTEKGVLLSGFGREIGLEDSDVNDNVAHSYFTSNEGMNIIDVDEFGRVLSMAIRGVELNEKGIDLDLPVCTPPEKIENNEEVSD